MHHPIRVAAAETTPVSLEEVKAHLRIDHPDQDAVIVALITAATAHLDGWTGVLGRALVAQTWRMAMDAFPGDTITIPLGPVTSVESIKYTDTAGAEQTVPTADYEVDLYPVEARICVGDNGWPSTDDVVNAVRVEWVAGYATADDVPDDLKNAILLLVGHWYEHREAATMSPATEIPMGVPALIAPYRRRKL